MKTDWELKKLGDLCEVITKGTTPTSIGYNFVDSGINFIKIESIDTNRKFLPNKFAAINEDCHQALKRSQLKKGDILFSIAGALGRTAIVSEIILPANTNQALSIIRLKTSANIWSDFILFTLQSDIILDQIKKFKGGAAQQNLSLEQVRNFQFPLPPLPEQQRIVAILDEAFAAIEQAKANAQRNLQNARELFDSYLQSVFANPGEGWEEKTLEEVCGISSKLIDPRNAEFLDTLHVGGANIESITGKLLDLKTAKEEGLISGKFLFNESMVLYSKIRPYLMKVAKPNFSGLCSADIYPLLPFKDKMIRDYLFYLLLSPDFTQYAINGSARAGMPKVNREHLFEYRFHIGSITDQTSIVAKLDSLSAETKKLEAIYQQKVTDLDELKKSILQKAFRGELSKTQGDALCVC